MHRSRRDGSRWQVDTRSSFWHRVVTSEQPIDGNLAGDDRRCRSNGRGRVWAVTGVVAGRVRNGFLPAKE
jgi:hypothetical protein